MRFKRYNKMSTAKKKQILVDEQQIFDLIKTVKDLTAKVNGQQTKKEQPIIKQRESRSQIQARVKEIAQSRKDQIVAYVVTTINPDTGTNYTVSEVRNAFVLAHNYTRIMNCEKGQAYKETFNNKLFELIGVKMYV